MLSTLLFSSTTTPPDVTYLPPFVPPREARVQQEEGNVELCTRQVTAPCIHLRLDKMTDSATFSRDAVVG